MLLEIGVLSVYFVILDHMNGLDSSTFHRRLQSRYMVYADALLFIVCPSGAWLSFFDLLHTTVCIQKNFTLSNLN